MRYIKIYQDGKKYITMFVENDVSIWYIESYIIMSHEIMVAWIETGVHPEYRYT